MLIGLILFVCLTYACPDVPCIAEVACRVETRVTDFGTEDCRRNHWHHTPGECIAPGFPDVNWENYHHLYTTEWNCQTQRPRYYHPYQIEGGQCMDSYIRMTTLPSGYEFVDETHFRLVEHTEPSHLELDSVYCVGTTPFATGYEWVYDWHRGEKEALRRVKL